MNGFQAFSTPQVIEFSNLSLIYGPNSSGKSSIFRLLQVLKANPFKGRIDRVWTFRGDETIYGSFEEMVSNHDLGRNIEVGLSFDVTRQDPRDVEDREKWRQENAPRIRRRPSGDNSFKLEVVDPPTPEPDVRTYAIPVEIDFQIGGNSRITRLSIRVPQFYLPSDHLEEVQDDSLHFNPVAQLVLTSGDEYDDMDWSVSSFDGTSFGDVTRLAWLNNLFASGTNWRESRKVTALELNQLSFKNLRDAEQNDYAFEPYSNTFFDAERVKDSVDEPICAEMEFFLQNVLAAYEGIISKQKHIGPLREIPDLIQGDNNDFLPDEIPESLSRIWDLDAAHKWFRELTEDKFDFKLEPLNVDGRFIGKYALYVTKNEVHSTFVNVGVGLSQVIPILFALFPNKVGGSNALTLVEQPELHLHPRMQSDLADAFIEASSSSTQVIAETHSENFALRLGKRIRESCSGVADGLHTLLPEEVAISYVEPGHTGAQVKSLRFNDQGNFIDEWPISFVELRIDDFFK